jgi:hypothetical protein
MKFSPDLLDDFWDVINRCMKWDPRIIRKLFGKYIEYIRKKIILSVLYNGKIPIGCGLYLRQKERLSVIHAVFMKKYRPTLAGEYLYWSIIEECYRLGIKIIDIGRSLVGTGNEVFKMHWHPRKIPLGYWYKLSSGVSLPHLNQDNPKYQLAIYTWQRLPLPISRIIGPKLIFGIL